MSARDKTAQDESEARDFKASDLLKLAGLTYRQLSDWENRAGVLTSQRATDAGWRKFTVEELIALCVCASLCVGSFRFHWKKWVLYLRGS